MLVEQLSTAYKCHSSIGNSINLKEMITEVIKTFISESYAIYGEFYQKEEESLKKIVSFGKLSNFDIKNYDSYTKPMSLITEEKINIIKMNLDQGIIFLVSKNKNADCSFFYSMFESLIPRLNLSISSCINYEKLLVSYDLVKKQKIELQKANKTKDEFLANMSHELKTPLNSILLLSTLMSKNKDDKYDEKTLKNMDIIKKCSLELMDLINDILDISQLEAGKVSIHNESIDLKVIIEDIYASMKEMTLNKNIDLIMDFKGNHFTMISDKRRIRQIIKNLVSNAIKFTSEGYVKITLTELFDRYQIDIEDTGIGLDNDKLEQIFDRFKQADGSTTRKYGGTGLGLSISKELAILLNGDILVKSQKNKGSIFTFEITKQKEDNVIKSFIKNDDKLNGENNNIKTNIIVYLKDTIEQFKLTIKLKKCDYHTFAALNEESFITYLEKLKDEKAVILIDERVKDFENIIKLINDLNYKKIITVTNNIELDESLLNKIEKLIKG
ncbi:hypothetical protein GCM10012288_20290 [Malaciobacter pacificus]|uniref:histidine kinase n=1 Tax=Malaciobacter pacificus TaxID=1080223 RepID=A0A5C2H5P1_9BACT|nr:HAMP domain-containing sensor histidine kinase [Malaciobacter pacificus]QEP34291.1 signal transduction sensor histidine kinase [Malaciobacter pacificus]GGD45946.1 hypothetical protein GCM10012288_20290 [Malaciobacter pacificus]